MKSALVGPTIISPVTQREKIHRHQMKFSILKIEEHIFSEVSVLISSIKYL
jgi:hypothetical protein